MVPQRKAAWLLLLALLLPILAACGSSGTGGGTAASGAASTGGAAASTVASTPAESAAASAMTSEAASASAAASTEASASSAASTEASASASAAASTAAGASASAQAGAPPLTEIPQGLRTDLKGKSIKWIGSADGPGAPYDDALAAAFTKATGINVQVIRGDQSATDRLATYNNQLGAGSGDVDVYQIDVIWPGILADNAEDLSQAFPNAKSDFFPAIVANNTVKGKLVGIPWFTDAGLLYYRKDLLQKYGFNNPPATWAELETQAKKIQDGERANNKDFWGFVWQGKAYEGLTCNALEWQVANGGGFIVEPDGTVSVNNPQTIAALNRAKGWIGNISPAGVTTYQEEESRNIWQAGNAAFMRNWPYAFSLGQKEGSAIKDKFDVTVLPKGDGPNARNADTLGGWQLMLNKNSKNKDAAIEFVKFLTSAEAQKYNSVGRSLLPTRPNLYDDPTLLQANPYYKSLKPVFSGGAVARPSSVTADLYNDVSTAYFTAVNQVLTGQKDAQGAMADLETKLKDILK